MATVLQNDKWHKTKADDETKLACGPFRRGTTAGVRKYFPLCNGCKEAFAASASPVAAKKKAAKTSA